MKSKTQRPLVLAALIAGICCLVPGCFRDCNYEDEATAAPVCVDYDGDGYGALYPGEQVGMNFPRARVACLEAQDCDDHDPDNWNDCATCRDQDGDGWYGACNVFVGVNGPDCDDADPDNWLSCATCADNDHDSFFVGCDAYDTISGQDCDDGDSLTYPEAPEICDGLDNNCDGIIDEGVQTFAKMGQDLRLTDDANHSRNPSLSCTGSEFGVSWHDDRDGNYEIYFARISAAGTKIGTDLRVTSNAGTSYFPSLSWTGSEFGVSWQNSGIYFARISVAGTKIGSDLRVDSSAHGYSPSNLSWTGSEFGVSWQYDWSAPPAPDQYHDIFFSRVSAAGDKIGSDLQVSSGGSYCMVPSLSWTGSEFGVSWTDYRDGNQEIYFARIGAAGGKIGSDLRVTSDASDSWTPSLSWTGSEFGISWEDKRDGNYEIYFARVSPAGSKVGSDLRVTNAAGNSRYSSLSWTGSEFGVSWEDERDGNQEIYFARLGLTCP